MITKILIAVASLIFVLVIVVVLQPSEFRVTRTATVSAPAVAFDQVNCEKMVGGIFEEGLSNLKAVAEAETIG